MKTFCRLCEVNCGLEVELDESGGLSDVRPDADHPVSHGFACHKGLLAKEVHHDPDRINHPERRTTQGFERVSWDESVKTIAAQLKKVTAEHGPRSVAVYLGNPSAFNALGAMSVGMFAASIGAERLFNAGTQDCANKFSVSEILYGSAEIHPVADVDHTDYLLLIGTNPRISKMSFLSTPDPVGVLREARKRGAEITFVNPVDLTDLSDIGPTLQIRPDTDAYLLAALLCEIDRNDSLGWTPPATTTLLHLDTLQAFVQDYAPERVASVVGVDVDEIRAMARGFATADAAAVHLSTGVNMGRQGSLAYYLAQMLSLVTGNLDRVGGNILPARGVPPMVMPPEASAPQSTVWGDYRPARGTPPGSLLGEMIRDKEDPIRAMFVIAGNPVLSIAGGEDLREAFESLDLLVAVDFYRNATGELADHVLPAADWFEREDLNYFVQGVQRTPYLQWTDAVVEPQAERQPDWWIFSRLLEELELPSLFDIPGGDVMSALWDGRLGETGHSVQQLRDAEGHVVRLPEAPAGGFLDRVSGKQGFDTCPAELRPSLERAPTILEDLINERGEPLKLITRRTNYMMNSGLQNLKALRNAKGGGTNPLFMNSRDALDRGLREGQFARVSNDHGELRAEIAFDDRLRQGVVAMSHGFGNAQTSGMPTAQATPGVNVNTLSPRGAGSFDPIGGMAHLTGIQVEVEAA